MTEKSAERDARQGWQFPSPVSLLGYLLGALSLTHLLEDVNLVRLRGALKNWIDAYSLLVKRINDFLFGWISEYFSWMRVDQTEAHMLVFWTLLYSSVLRANNEVTQARLGERIIEFIGYFGLGILITLILPLPWGVIVLFLVLVYDGWVLAISGYNNPGFAPPRRVRHQLLNVTIVFVIIIVANYTLFPKP